MSHYKKIVICVILCLLFNMLCIGLFYFNKNNKISSIITLDINPSLRLFLNYKSEIVKADGLNEDGKRLLKTENFKYDDIEDAIEDIVEYVVENNIIKDNEVSVLVNVIAKNSKLNIEKIINDEFKSKKVKCSVIQQEISDTAKVNAEKYGISESKASYIEYMIEKHENLTFEDLKDKTIKEIDEIVNSETSILEDEILKEDAPENNDYQKDEKPSKPSQNNSSAKPVVNPPASNDRTGAWCEFYKTIPPQGGVEYETPGYISDSSKYIEASKKYLPEDSDWSSFFNSITSYESASYCSAGFVELENYDKTKTYRVYMDSVTLEMLELVVKELPKASIDESVARPIISKVLLDNYNIDINNCDWENYYYNIDGSTKIPEWQYTCKIESTNTYYAVTVVATNGIVKSHRYWTN